MVRKIIKIDEEKCNGCGLCATACHEGAIEMVNGKAKLVRESFCDGLGDCLPNCPTGAIAFEEREAPEYDEKAVLKAKQKKLSHEHVQGGCPGSRAGHSKQSLRRKSQQRADPFRGLRSGPARSSSFPRMRHSLTARSCLSPPTARLTPMHACTRSSCAAELH